MAITSSSNLSKNYYICVCLQRLLLPICLTISVLIRPTLISSIYLCFLLYLPFIPVMSMEPSKGPTGQYFSALIVTSFLISVLHVCFHIVLFSMQPYGHFLENCSLLEKILRQIGLIRVNSITALDMIQWFIPEILILSFSLGIYVMLRRLTSSDNDTLLEEGQSRLIKTTPKMYSNKFFISFGAYVTLFSLCLAGIIRPSVPGSLYFLTFLLSATYRSCCQKFGRKFAIYLRCLLIPLTIHIFALYAYQFQFVQDLIDSQNQYCRFFGIVPIIKYTCSDPRKFFFVSDHWDNYMYPILLIFLYYVLVIESKLILKPQHQDNPQKKKLGKFSRFDNKYNNSLTRQLSSRLARRKNITIQKRRWLSAARKIRVSYDDDSVRSNENTPLLSGVNPGLKYSSTTSSTRRNISQDSAADNDLFTANQDSEADTDGEEINEPDFLENVLITIDTAVQKIIQSSYIAANITMMAWSITYHSWLTFVLMLWAIVLWIFPNQRRSMMRSSPFIVIYSFFLMISQYVYCMDLTESELPSVIQGINLAQIGFKKILVLPFNPLFIKSTFTVMFLITMRQYMRERNDGRRNSSFADMVAPLQLAMGAAVNTGTEPKGTKVMKRFVEIVQVILIKFWIWVVVMMLFVSGITGDRMTGVRIVYMALFLFFVLTFQLSYNIWRKIMYAFWMTVIIISVTILVLVYTYQFDHFSEYWRDYLKVPLKLQLDIGLEVFETKQLFVRLLTPTFFVVITVIQMQYFHEDFLKMTELKARTANISTTHHLPTTQKSMSSRNIPDSIDVSTLKLSGLRKVSAVHMQKTYNLLVVYVRQGYNLCMMWLDFQITKIVGIVAMLLCVYDICAIHLCLVVLLVMGFSAGRLVRKPVIFLISFIVSIMILCRMIYQMEYIDHSRWNVHCVNSSSVFNTASWLGFKKADNTTSLNQILTWYLTFIFLVTFRSIIFIRQTHRRLSNNEQMLRPNIMFTDINRKNADNDLQSFIKYLFNYGFYKFGVEITLITIVALMGIRMDMYALIYGVWLFLMFNRSRIVLARIWHCFFAFVVTVIPLQYCMVIGLPPVLCIDMPWSNSTDETWIQFQDWAFLIDPLHPPDAKKIICDFIVLILVFRQILVFRIEYQYRDGNIYPGGSNESIIHLAENPDFVNPVNDFIAYMRSWLDVFKKVVLLSFLWIALAAVFLAGANRINLFSVGYLIGSFWFLWQGNDIYLKPVPTIIKSWNLLLTYNVTVIFLKCVLQIFGCIFMTQVQQKSCWIIQLLGIGCLKKLSALPDAVTLLASETCSVSNEDIGLGWDAICFVALILQRRLFSSYNLFHIIEDTKAMTILASRGAELIEELRQKQIVQMSEHEIQVLEKIKRKMDRIKRNQQRIQGPCYQEPNNHYVDRQVRRFSKSSTISRTSPPGFHTPIIEEDSLDDTLNTTAPPLTVTTTTATATSNSNTITNTTTNSLSVIQLQKTSPNSVILTGSLDEYLEPRGMSFGLGAEGLLSTRQDFESPSLTHSTIFDDSLNLSTTIATKRRVLQDKDPNSSFYSHHTSIRSGDYYMFDVIDDDEDDDLELSVMSMEDSLERTVEKTRGLTIFEFIDTTLKSDMDAPLKVRYGIETKPKKVKRRLSEPIVQSKQPHLFHTYSFTGEKPQSTEATTSGFVPIPSTSKSPEGSDYVIKEPVASDESLNVFQKVYRILLFIWVFIESILLSATNYLNRFSRNYRIVSRALKKEKIILKEFTDFTKGSRRGSNQIWQPNYTFHALMEKAKTTMSEEKLQAFIDISELPPDNQPTVVRFLLAVWFIVLSHSEILCYFAIFLNQIKSASILSLPLPLLVFLWGTLTVPRPTISFWVVIIAYTEIIVLLKCLSQFELISWTQDTIGRNPLFLPRIIGIERKPYYATYDLLLLMVVFFHRFMLKSLGLWKSKPDVTLIPELYYKKDENQEISLLDKNFKGGKRRTTRFESLRFRSRSKTTISGVQGDPERKIIDFDMTKDPKRLSKQIGVQIVSRNYIMKKKFFARLMDPFSKVPTDVYAYMFLCDFINFLVIIFGFSDFGAQQGDGGVSAYLEENKVPIPFLAMLILQFALIIIDRAIFLRKSIVGKMWFQFIIIFGAHVGMFFVLPALTERKFNSKLAPQLWYLMKCFYLLLSAYQIRSGYPTRILGNFLCKGYNYINMVLYKGFMLIPFLFELRTIMDWMWTDTSMTIFDWLKMEDIYSHIYQLKCSRYVEKEYPQERGARKSPMIKYFMGGAGLVFVISIIWFPLVLFAFGNTVGKPNVPFEMKLTLDLGPYESLYRSTVQNSSVFRFSESDYETFKNIFKVNREAQQFLSNYDFEDVGVIKMTTDSGSIWTISPPDHSKLIADLNSDTPMSLKLTYALTRFSNTKTHEIVLGDNSIDLPQNTGNETDSIRNNLIKAINESSDTKLPILVTNILPKFVKVTSRATISNVPQLIQQNIGNDKNMYRNMTLTLEEDVRGFKSWWKMQETCTDQFYVQNLSKIQYADCDSLVFYTFSDKIFPPTLSIISGGGIISLYTTLVFVASRVIRGFFSDICFKIMFEDMPNVDRILQLCLDIYLVRESRELALEEDLFAKLVFLFRSPETLIKWSRPKDENRRLTRYSDGEEANENSATYNLTPTTSEQKGVSFVQQE